MDVEVGDLVAPMFSLGYQFAVPDVLYYEELEEQHAHLLDMEKGFTREEAVKAMRVLLRLKMAKLNPVLGRIVMVRGVFWDADVLRAAADRHV